MAACSYIISSCNLYYKCVVFPSFACCLSSLPITFSLSIASVSLKALIISLPYSHFRFSLLCMCYNGIEKICGYIISMRYIHIDICLPFQLQWNNELFVGTISLELFALSTRIYVCLIKHHQNVPVSLFLFRF